MILLPATLVQSASLDPGSIIGIVLMDHTTFFKDLVPALHIGFAKYTVNLANLNAVSPARKYAVNPSWNFPQIARRTGDEHFMFIEFPLEGENGLRHPMTADCAPTKEYF